MEALVTMALVGLVLALLLPAVQVTRESSRRMQCTSHLHQIGIAAHSYEMTHGVFPGAALLGGGQWREQLLPYLEQRADAKGAPVYACPADEFGGYLVNDGLWPKDSNGFAKVAPWVYVRPVDITDGLSNTAAFADKLEWPTHVADKELPADSFHQYWIRRMRNTRAFVADMDAFADECRDNALPPPRAWHVVWGYNHVMTPNQNSCFNGPRTQAEHLDFAAMTTTSGHPGGVNVLYADGGVRFASDHVDRTVWRALGTRNGGEAVSVNW